MAGHKNNSGDRSRKVLNALDGADEFSVFSVEPEARKPLVNIESETVATGRPEDTPVSHTVIRFLRKIFRD
jgi:hypothetical protein